MPRARAGPLPPEARPRTECLKDVLERMLPYWYDAVVPDLGHDRTVLIVAHGNSLRALRMHLEGLGEDEITGLEIPTGIPFVLEMDDRLRVTSSRYLGDAEAAAKAAEAVARQAG